jgi:sulfite dehydrogenase (quinone) subunit SoeC
LKPALSIVFFTVVSGAGLGLLSLLALFSKGGISIVVAMTLVSAGLLASFLHLANPRNAWRSFARFRTSWLSREAVFAVILYPVAAAWFLGMQFFSWAALVLAWVILFCTAMIYASLKPIREWRTPLTPLNYFLLGHYSGAALALAITGDPVFKTVFLVLLLAAGAAKVAYYREMETAARPTVQSAVTMPTAARVKLLDAGHTHGNFLTEEFAFRLARSRAEELRVAVAVVGFLLPLLLVLLLKDANRLAAILCIGGLLVERWLFFAEARHTVNLYQARA